MYLQSKMVLIIQLPDEIILKIFQNLNFQDLGHCAQVCKKFHHISQDESLWHKINLYEKRVQPEFIQHALENGTKYLSLFCAKMYGEDPKFPKGHQLKYLDLGFSTIQEELLLHLASTSCYLEKLSLGWLEINLDLVGNLVQNCETLKILHLFDCTGLKNSIELIIDSFDNLIELNLGQTKLCSESIKYLCRNLTPNVEKLSLEKLKVQDEDIEILMKRCQKLKELDLTSCSSITNITVTKIIQSLSKTLGMSI